MNDTMVDSLSYKQLQALAMSLNLPGKMKQAVLVDAIKARQSGNENAVSDILEANRRRRIFRRQQQQQQQQQQLLKFHEGQIAKRRCLSRRMKRPVGEMESKSSGVDQELVKRAKLASGNPSNNGASCPEGISSNVAANVSNGHFRRRPIFFASNVTKTAPATPQSDPIEAPEFLRGIRQEVSGPAVWDDQTTSSSPDLACVEPSFDSSTATPTPVDLLQPSIGDCSTGTSVCSRFLADSSSGGSGTSPLSCQNSSTGSTIPPLQNDSGIFENYDSWNYDEPYPISEKSRSLPNIKLGMEIPSGESTITSTGVHTIGAADSSTLGQSSSCSYLDDIFNSLYPPEPSNANVYLNDSPAGGDSASLEGADRVTSAHHPLQNEDFSLLPDFPSQRPVVSSAPPERVTNSDSNYSSSNGACSLQCEEQIMTTDYRLPRTGAEPSNSCGWTDDFFSYTNASSFPNQFPCFQIQRPGNWMPLTVASGGGSSRVITCVTFCNTLPRVSSITYDHHNENA